jgi:hypothetical protein
MEGADLSEGEDRLISNYTKIDLHLALFVLLLFIGLFLYAFNVLCVFMWIHIRINEMNKKS